MRLDLRCVILSRLGETETRREEGEKTREGKEQKERRKWRYLSLCPRWKLPSAIRHSGTWMLHVAILLWVMLYVFEIDCVWLRELKSAFWLLAWGCFYVNACV